MTDFTHINEEGRARMVDVTEKETTCREAIAEATVRMNAATMNAILTGGVKKGDVLAVAQVAGIMAAKKTADIIPMCHPIPLSAADISFTHTDTELYIRTRVRCQGSTGVEMEALTAASAAALTVYDMCKAIQRDMEITDVRLVYKNGGKSGEFRRCACVSALCVSERKGTKKHPVPSALFEQDFGIVGDAHAGKWHRQVSLLAKESVDTMRGVMPALAPGDFAENILTEGIDLKNLPVGTRLRVGQTELEITQIGKECHADCEIRRLTGRCVMPTDGVFARVITGGIVHVGDPITILQ